MNARDDLDRAAEHLDRAGEHAGDAARHTEEAMEAGASGTLERTKDAARKTGEMARQAGSRAADLAKGATRAAGNVADRVRNLETDKELEQRVDHTTENILHKAGDAIKRAAPTVGRGAEVVVGATGSALSGSSRVIGLMVGRIAGRVGGWWGAASESMSELPREEEQACRIHFEAYTARPREMTFDQARPGYSLGYMASRNPEYHGRAFDEVEPDLRHGFGGDTGDYGSLRDFTRYGYQRGTGRP